jgi:2-oxoglutarate/2-oxoacid ferredoxin oxidoreductase subunit alpha
MPNTSRPDQPRKRRPSLNAGRKEVERVTIRFAGDSGDGMQLVGTQFTNTSAVLGNDVSTLPDYPAEIRAPAGSIAGVSAFQISFSSEQIFTPGDQPDVLVAMNPAALKANLDDVLPGGTIIVNKDEFTKGNLKKAAYEASPLESHELSGYQVFEAPITTLTLEALKDTELTASAKARCKNFFALGLMYWLYHRPLAATLEVIQKKFATKGDLRDANIAALKAGHAFGETAEMFSVHFHVPPAELVPGEYRNITGNEATALGFLTAAELAKRPLFYGSYPITPASDVLHYLARYKNFGVRTFQAEDEIAAMGSTIGAAYGGSLALTGTSGPGLALKGEAIGMAVIIELPVVIINVQRAGPSTGMPTKTEQSDLLQAMYGRNGDSPVAVIAPLSPADCYEAAIDAFRIATRFMTPVIFLTDGYLGNGSEPWLIPKLAELPPLEVKIATDPEGFQPYSRDEVTMARPWSVPGTKGMEHRVGTLEKDNITGNVSHDAENHQVMTDIRSEKMRRIADFIPEQTVFGPEKGDVLVVGWGSTYGSIRSAVHEAHRAGLAVGHAHLRHLNPLPKKLGEIMRSYKHVLIPELNTGQLSMLLRAKYLVDAKPINKVSGQPFRISEIYQAITQALEGGEN